MGRNNYGLLGDGSSTQRNTPVSVGLAGNATFAAGSGITQLDAGGFHSAVLEV
jgi:hypothetical protein